MAYRPDIASACSAFPVQSGLPRRILRLGAALAIFCLGCVVAVLAGGVIYSASITGADGLWAAFRPDWNPGHGRFGIFPMLAGSFILAGAATLMAIPLCLGLMGFLWGERSTMAGRAIRLLLRFMVSIPTVVYAFCAVLLLVPMMRGAFAGTGLNALTTSLVLALLILPTMALVLDSALHQLFVCPAGLPLAAAALGLNRQQCFWFVALASQKRWLGTGILLALGRALGDTMLPLMLSGNAPVLPDSPLSSVRTLATHISLLTATEITPQVELTLYLSGALLLLTSTGVSLCAKLLQRDRA